MKHSIGEARAAKRALVDQLQGIGQVTGIGITEIENDYAVQVYLREPVSRNLLPEVVNDIPVKVDVIGPVSTDY
jgi:hypothetical protein